MEYSLMNPPFEIVEFSEMKKKDAQQHFDWYISQIPRRITLLAKAYEITGGGTSSDFDYSKTSLGKLWSWYLKNIEIVRKSDEELKVEYQSANEMTKHNIKTEKISIGWMAIANDISIYFSECMLKMHNNLEWGFVAKPKSLIYVNKPVVVGFKNRIKMDGSHLLFIQTRKILRGIRDENAIEKLFNNWAKQA